MSKIAQKQRGMTLIGALCAAIFIGAIGLLAMRLFPVYSQNFAVKQALSTIASDPPVDVFLDHVADSVRVKKLFLRQMSLEGIQYITAKDLHTSRTNRGVLLTVKYQAKVPLIANIEVLVSFSEKALVKNNGAS